MRYAMPEMFELTPDEMNEVVGGLGLAFVTAQSTSGAGSSLDVDIFADLTTSNTTALADISADVVSIVGVNNTLALNAFALVV
jgi:hypothetical protein